MSLKYERRLLAHLKHERYTPANIETLAHDLGVAEEDHAAFEAAVDDLISRKMLMKDGSSAVRLPSMPDEVVGSFRKNPRGFGFVIPAVSFREGDIFIPPDSTGNALTGDTVRVRVTRSMRNGERDITGDILEVVDRKRAGFTGELRKRGGLWVVLPDGNRLECQLSSVRNNHDNVIPVCILANGPPRSGLGQLARCFFENCELSFDPIDDLGD